MIQKYNDRIIDKEINEAMEILGGILIVGPKGCGKTTTGTHFCKTKISFEDEDRREELLSVANTKPSMFFSYEKPILFDEWQDAPKIWGAVRKYIDDNMSVGDFILTGSSSRNIDTPHSGTLRIGRIKMYPLSLYETKESNGSVSLSQLFNNPDSFESCRSELTIEDLIFAICRGGWPSCLRIDDKEKQLKIVRYLYDQLYSVDISHIDKVKRNPKIARALLHSYSRNICTFATNKTILKDISPFDESFSMQTYLDYVDAFERLFIIEDIDAWSPSIRSATSIRASQKRNMIDPSIAVAALGLSPDYFNKDFKTLGFLFESLCIRDLKIYSSRLGGKISYYHDRYGLEADAVLHIDDGRYALIEIKLGSDEIELGANHLCEIERLIHIYNEKEKQCPLRLPDLKIVLTGTEFGYKRDDGVYVIPIGCLKD